MSSESPQKLPTPMKTAAILNSPKVLNGDTETKKHQQPDEFLIIERTNDKVSNVELRHVNSSSSNNVESTISGGKKLTNGSLANNSSSSSRSDDSTSSHLEMNDEEPLSLVLDDPTELNPQLDNQDDDFAGYEYESYQLPPADEVNEKSVTPPPCEAAAEAAASRGVATTALDNVQSSLVDDAIVAVDVDDDVITDVFTSANSAAAKVRPVDISHFSIDEFSEFKCNDDPEAAVESAGIEADDDFGEFADFSSANACFAEWKPNLEEPQQTHDDDDFDDEFSEFESTPINIRETISRIDNKNVRFFLLYNV